MEKLKRGRLYRSLDRVFGGVCSGLAEYFKVDTVLVRIVIVVLAIVAMIPVTILYGVLWLVLPARKEGDDLIEVNPSEAYSDVHGQTAQFKLSAKDLAEDGESADESSSDESGKKGFNTGAIVAFVIGLVLLIASIVFIAPRVFAHASWFAFWPVALVVLGLARMVLPGKAGYTFPVFLLGMVLFICGAVLLPMTLGLIDYSTIGNAFVHLWPLLVMTVAFLLLSKAFHPNVCYLLAVACFLAFFVLGFIVYAVPGPLESLDIVLFDKGMSISPFPKVK